ncbi:hypothetical protein BDV29DRAFT_181187 [Aspergillus leporis]|uniref:Uncharacterized protein n=1 Tax=Aspergillus leporis TaxID=41062 RepID=A0A5N5WR79_9EURO|nr:hypothetical protein BDV29DRAFT_181187 [Aspergillus leporis]
MNLNLFRNSDMRSLLWLTMGLFHCLNFRVFYLTLFEFLVRFGLEWFWHPLFSRCPLMGGESIFSKR